MLYKLTKTLTATTAIACVLATGAHAALTISNAKTKRVTCASGVCTPTAGNANLNAGDLQTMLASSDVTVKSDASTLAIGVLDPLTWASTHRLTLDAYESIHVRAPIVVEGTAGVTLITNDGGTDGDYTFNTTTLGAITFWDTASSLVINGRSFMLVKDIKTLASNIASHPARAYALAADYDASADGTYGTAAIPASFSGTFDGLGHAIAQLTVVAKGLPGALFADLGAKSTVRDLGVTNANIEDGKHASLNAAALAVQNEGRIAYVFSTGSIQGLNYSILGGLVAVNSGQIVQSSSSVNIVAGTGAGATAGGLVGTTSGSIENSHATGSVTGNIGGTAGGLAGAVLGGRVVSSFATGKVTGGFPGRYLNVSAGGLAGTNKGMIVASFATGAMDNFDSTPHRRGSCCLGNIYLGGLVGDNENTIKNAYAIGSLTVNSIADNYATGGLVGLNNGSIEAVYSTEFVDTDRPNWGGLIGYDASKVRRGYWDFDTSGVTDPGQGAGLPRNDVGITGLTDAQLKSALPAGFDPNVWGQSASINNGWPYLLANPPQ